MSFIPLSPAAPEALPYPEKLFLVIPGGLIHMGTFLSPPFCFNESTVDAIAKSQKEKPKNKQTKTPPKRKPQTKPQKSPLKLIFSPNSPKAVFFCILADPRLAFPYRLVLGNTAEINPTSRSNVITHYPKPS